MLGGSAHVLRHNSIGRSVCVFDRGTIVYFCGTVLQPASFAHRRGGTKVWGPVRHVCSFYCVLHLVGHSNFDFFLCYFCAFIHILRVDRYRPYEVDWPYWEVW